MTHPPGFEYTARGRSGYMYCTVCDARGLSFEAENPLPWAINCIEHPEHPYVCKCTRRYPSRIALASHIKARNTRWPDGQQHYVRLESLALHADRPEWMRSILRDLARTEPVRT